MSAPLLHVRCYLVEWYRPELTEELLDSTVNRLNECASSMSADGSAVELRMALAVPNDDLVFGVFVAGSEQLVARVCDEAGIPAQRLSLAVDARANHRETPDSARPPLP